MPYFFRKCNHRRKKDQNFFRQSFSSDPSGSIEVFFRKTRKNVISFKMRFHTEVLFSLIFPQTVNFINFSSLTSYFLVVLFQRLPQQIIVLRFSQCIAYFSINLTAFILSFAAYINLLFGLTLSTYSIDPRHQRSHNEAVFSSCHVFDLFQYCLSHLVFNSAHMCCFSHIFSLLFHPFQLLQHL